MHARVHAHLHVFVMPSAFRLKVRLGRLQGLKPVRLPDTVEVRVSTKAFEG